MTEVPTQQPQQPPQETDAEKVVRAQFIIDTLRRRISEEIDNSVGLESRIAMLDAQLQQESTIRLAMVAEIQNLHERLAEYEPDDTAEETADADPDGLREDEGIDPDA